MSETEEAYYQISETDLLKICNLLRRMKAPTVQYELDALSMAHKVISTIQLQADSVLNLLPKVNE